MMKFENYSGPSFKNNLKSFSIHQHNELQLFPGWSTYNNKQKQESKSKPQNYFAITSLSTHESRSTLLLHYRCVLKSHELLAFLVAELEQNHVRGTLLTIKLRMEEL